MDERFCRMWEFYLAGSEARFRYQNLVVFQMQLARRVDALPWPATTCLAGASASSLRARDATGAAAARWHASRLAGE